MADTEWIPSIAVARWRDAPLFSEAIADREWRVAATALVDRPTDDDNWAITCVLAASVDEDAVGDIRLRLASPIEWEDDTASIVVRHSPQARIVSHVSPVQLGWSDVLWPSGGIAPLTVSLEARRSRGAGGVRIHRAALTLESVPNSSRDVIYPPGYDPGEDAAYPPDYNTEEPYGA